MKKLPETVADIALSEEPTGLERAEAKRLSAQIGTTGPHEETIARRLAAYRIWLRQQWTREQKDKRTR